MKRLFYSLILVFLQKFFFKISLTVAADNMFSVFIFDDFLDINFKSMITLVFFSNNENKVKTLLIFIHKWLNYA